MFALRITILTIIISLNYEHCSCGCAHAEYEINKQCCPMCAPGNCVLWHCTDHISTTCVPCPPSTFTDQPNGLMKCFPCTVCDANRGLRVSKACTRSSDTVCEPLEGFYCTEQNKGSCRFAVQHSECSPGQYIKQTGTGSTDTVCTDCTGDTYSNGSFSSCLPHTKCEALGLTETNPGTQSSDSECGNPPTASTAIALGVIVPLIIIITVVSVYIIKRIQKRKRTNISGIQVATKDLKEEARLPDRINVEPDWLGEQATLKNLQNPGLTADFSQFRNTSTQIVKTFSSPKSSDCFNKLYLEQNPKNLAIMHRMNLC